MMKLIYLTSLFIASQGALASVIHTNTHNRRFNWPGTGSGSGSGTSDSTCYVDVQYIQAPYNGGKVASRYDYTLTYRGGGLVKPLETVLEADIEAYLVKQSLSKMCADYGDSGGHWEPATSKNGGYVFDVQFWAEGGVGGESIARCVIENVQSAMATEWTCDIGTKHD